MTAMRGKRGCPTSLHQTRTSTSCVMSDPSSFLPITALLWITGIWSQSCISILVFSTSDVCGDLPLEVDGTVCAGDTILHNKRQQSDVIQSLPVTSTRRRREKLTCCVRESWTWRCLQILLQSSESMRLWLLSNHLSQQNRQPPAP